MTNAPKIVQNAPTFKTVELTHTDFRRYRVRFYGGRGYVYCMSTGQEIDEGKRLFKTVANKARKALAGANA